LEPVAALFTCPNLAPGCFLSNPEPEIFNSYPQANLGSQPDLDSWTVNSAVRLSDHDISGEVTPTESTAPSFFQIRISTLSTMNTRQQLESPSTTQVLSVSFNADGSCFSVGLNTGICGKSNGGTRSDAVTKRSSIPNENMPDEIFERYVGALSPI
jgi:hypothetical protein